jgi:hypothetical protein
MKATYGGWFVNPWATMKAYLLALVDLAEMIWTRSRVSFTELIFIPEEVE